MTQREKGQHVEELAKASRAELNQWIGQARSAWGMARRDRDNYATRRARLDQRYAEDCRELEEDRVSAPERIAGLERQIAKLEAQLAQLEAPKPKPVAATERQSKIDALMKRLLAGDTTAALELKAML